MARGNGVGGGAGWREGREGRAGRVCREFLGREGCEARACSGVSGGMDEGCGVVDGNRAKRQGRIEAGAGLGMGTAPGDSACVLQGVAADLGEGFRCGHGGLGGLAMAKACGAGWGGEWAVDVGWVMGGGVVAGGNVDCSCGGGPGADGGGYEGG